MSDWEAEYDENGGAISKPPRVRTPPCTHWKGTSTNIKGNGFFGGKRGGKVDREGPQWRNWRERDREVNFAERSDSNISGERSASTRPLTLTLDNSLIGRVIGKLAL